MSRIYILEDDPNRMKRFKPECIGHSMVHDDTADEFIQKLEAETEHIDVMFLDHDLGGEQFVSSADANTGMEVVRWLVNNKKNIGRIIVHTLNPPAGEEMVYRLKHAGYETLQAPFLYLNFSGNLIENIVTTEE